LGLRETSQGIVIIRVTVSIEDAISAIIIIGKLLRVANDTERVRPICRRYPDVCVAQPFDQSKTAKIARLCASPFTDDQHEIVRLSLGFAT
jgi:hypothetical protein